MPRLLLSYLVLALGVTFLGAQSAKPGPNVSGGPLGPGRACYDADRYVLDVSVLRCSDGALLGRRRARGRLMDLVVSISNLFARLGIADAEAVGERARPATEDEEAYASYLLGRDVLLALKTDGSSLPDARRALDPFEVALRRDPGLRAALDAGLGTALAVLQSGDEEAAGAAAPLALRIRAELDLAAWRIDDARSAAEAYTEADPEDPWPWVTLALVHDVLGDAGAALDAQRRAHALDPEAVPAPFSVTDADFDAVVEETFAGLPELFRRALDGVRIVREPTPSPELAEAAPPDTPPDALGVFHGRTIHDEELSGELPPTVYLFRRNLERIAADRDELSHEIRITLLHEIGHALGLDEDEVAAMGLA